MKVKELIAQLQKMDENANVIVNSVGEIELVWYRPLDGIVDITTVPEEEEVNEMERDDFFRALAKAETAKSEAEEAWDSMMDGIGEMLDMLKINGVR